MALVGQPATTMDGRGSFQDTSGRNGSLNAEALLFSAVSVYRRRVLKPADIVSALPAALTAARTGGPATLLLPKDVSRQRSRSTDTAAIAGMLKAHQLPSVIRTRSCMRCGGSPDRSRLSPASRWLATTPEAARQPRGRGFSPERRVQVSDPPHEGPLAPTRPDSGDVTMLRTRSRVGDGSRPAVSMASATAAVSVIPCICTLPAGGRLQRSRPNRLDKPASVANCAAVSIPLDRQTRANTGVAGRRPGQPELSALSGAPRLSGHRRAWLMRAIRAESSRSLSSWSTSAVTTSWPVTRATPRRSAVFRCQMSRARCWAGVGSTFVVFVGRLLFRRRRGVRSAPSRWEVGRLQRVHGTVWRRLSSGQRSKCGSSPRCGTLEAEGISMSVDQEARKVVNRPRRW